MDQKRLLGSSLTYWFQHSRAARRRQAKQSKP